MEKAARKPPKPKTREAWIKKHCYIAFDSRDAMHCKVCTKWETEIQSSKNFSNAFIEGSTNYRITNVDSHFSSEMHLLSLQKEQKENIEKLGGQFTVTKKLWFLKIR
jgi:hypothetical protein